MTKYLFYLVLLLLPFSFATNPVAGIDLPITRILIPALFLIWLAESLLEKRLFIDIRPRMCFLLLFLLLSVFSVAWAPEISRAWRKILFLFSFLPIYFVAYDYFKKGSSKKLTVLKIITFTAFAQSLIGISQFLTQFFVGIDPTLAFWNKLNGFFLGNTFSETVQQYPSWLVNIGGETFIRAFGTFPDPHLFSFFVVLSLPITWYLFSQSGNKKYLLAGGVALAAIALSFSRASYLATLAFFLLIIMLESTTLRLFFIKKKRFSLAILLFIALTSAFLALVPNPATQRLASSFQLKEGSIQGRLQMWETAAQAIGKYPLGGVGIGNFSYFVKPSSDYREPIYAHNLFLDFGSEIGIIGLVLLVLIFLSPLLGSFAKIIRKDNTALNKLIFAFFVVFIVFSIFETPFYSIRIFPLFLIFLALPNENS